MNQDIPKPKEAVKELMQIMEELEIADRFPAAIEYMSHVMKELDPAEFYTAREQVMLKLKTGISMACPFYQFHEVDRHIHAGDKIAAIKKYRAVTGSGLKESKDAVEARMTKLGVKPGYNYRSTS